jgi:putative hydrolase of the HAD superfamily
MFNIWNTIVDECGTLRYILFIELTAGLRNKLLLMVCLSRGIKRNYTLYSLIVNYQKLCYLEVVNEMSMKPDLVLDIGGVIASNFSPFFWDDLSAIFEVVKDDLVKFKKEIREDLWTGKIDEKEFWIRLKNNFPTIEIEYAKSKLESYITPLPAIEELSIWNEYANIHLLSNHRLEWVKHIVTPVQKYIKSITISSEVGYCKPQVDIYLSVITQLNYEKNVLFVDDQDKNLKEANKLGWQTLLADEKGEWTKKVIPFLFSTDLYN